MDGSGRHPRHQSSATVTRFLSISCVFFSVACGPSANGDSTGVGSEGSGATADSSTSGSVSASVSSQGDSEIADDSTSLGVTTDGPSLDHLHQELCDDYQQVYRGGAMLESDADVDDLLGIECVDGALEIGLGVTSITALSAMQAIDGDLIIAADLPSLEGLEMLDVVAGSLRIARLDLDGSCAVLEDLADIGALAGLDECGDI